MTRYNKITVVGAGLVGSLLSIYLAKKGHKVSVFEKRSDMRKGGAIAGRSINLALSDRGWRGLARVGIADDIKKIAIPMYGRYIHLANGTIDYQPYGTAEQAIYSVSRSSINMRLMDLAEAQPNVQLHFDKTCTNIDKKNTTLNFTNLNGITETVASDFIFGADGAYSAVRTQLQLHSDRFNYNQYYIDCGYKELCIPVKADGTHMLEKNALHIWPRGQFMLIALPNIDGSFTCTLFLQLDGNTSFDALNSKEKIQTFFKTQFPDAFEIMPTLIHDFETNPTSSLVTVKCTPWVFNNNIALIGDAAHAIVPFYGQGMNCGFEDCVVLNELIEKHGLNAACLQEYETLRKPDGDAIADLAIANFIEMRDKTADKNFILQKKIEAKISTKYPKLWTPLYTMVTYSPEIRYSEALQRGQKQQQIMDKILMLDNIHQNWDSDLVEQKILEFLN